MADTQDLKSCGRMTLRVQVSHPLPILIRNINMKFVYKYQTFDGEQFDTKVEANKHLDTVESSVTSLLVNRIIAANNSRSMIAEVIHEELNDYIKTLLKIKADRELDYDTRKEFEV